MDVDPSILFWAILGFVWLQFVWSFYLDYRERCVYLNQKKVPAVLSDSISIDTFDKSRLYALDKSIFGIFNGIFEQVLATVFIYCFIYKAVWDIAGSASQSVLSCFGLFADLEIGQTVVFVFYLQVFNTVVGLPFSIYSTFVLEENHGFNKQTAGFFIKDQIKQFIIMLIIVVPLIAAVIGIVKAGGDYFVIYLWFFTFAFMMFMMFIYPEVIAPLFDKYSSLPEGNLRSQIEKLAGSIKFPLYKLFVVEGSKRSAHSNAYFYGFYKFKRIVLFDTLLEKSEREKLAPVTTVGESGDPEKDDGKGCKVEEILAVLAHELGHWKLNHLLKNMVISQIQLLVMFAVFGFFQKNQALYSAFGFTDSQPVLIGMMIILQFLLSPIQFFIGLGSIALSRRFEFQADAFAAQLGYTEWLKKALVKLNNDNLSFPVHDWLYSSCHHSHPTLLQRLAALDGKKNQ